MGPPLKQLLFVSIVESVAVGRLAPLSSPSVSYTLNAIIFFLVQFLIYFVYAVVIYPKYFSPLRSLPQPGNDSWIWGHFAAIRHMPNGMPHRKWIAEVPNNGLIRYRWMLNIERVMPVSPKALSEVLTTRSYEFTKPEGFLLNLGRILGVGILLAEGEEHKRQRKNLMPAFAFRHVKDLYPVFWSKAREVALAMTAASQAAPAPASLLPTQESEKTASLSALERPDPSIMQTLNWASRCTLDIIGLAGMGQDFHAIERPDHDLVATYRQVFSPPGSNGGILQLMALIMPFWILRRIPSKRNEEVELASKKIKNVCRELIANKRAKLEKGERTDVDILSVAIESGGFSDEDLVNQMMTFLAAGHETTASSLTWTIFLLCKNPDIQKRLREEVRSNLPSLNDPKASITSTMIDSLPYLNAVCNESIRFYPVVPITLRMAGQDTTILDQPIPKGTAVVLVPWAVNHSTELWGPDAGEFNPERWLDAGKSNSGGAESNYALMTFLHGPRSCIGKDFARAELAILLAAIVGRFEMSLPDPAYEPDIQGGVTSRPKDGLMVKYTPLEDW